MGVELTTLLMGLHSSLYTIYLCDKALLFTEEDKIVLGNVTEIGITSLHSSNDDTEESLPCVLNLRVPNIPMKTSLVQLVERRLLLMLTALIHCFSKYSRLLNKRAGTFINF